MVLPFEEDNKELNAKSTKTVLKFDDILIILGEFGKYQKTTFWLVCLPAIVCAIHGLCWVLLAPKVATRCQLPIESDSAPYTVLPLDLTFNDTYLQVDLEGTTSYSQCERFDVEFKNTGQTYEVVNIKPNTSEMEVVTCQGKYIYDTSTYASSARIDFQLVCDRNFLYTLEETAYKGGVLIGSLLFGDLSDRLGRRPMFLLCLAIQFAFGVAASFAPTFEIFITTRAIIGAASMGTFLIAFVIAVETVGPSRRKFVGVSLAFFWTGGYLTAGLLSYLISNWRWLQLAFCIPSIAFISYYWLLPESIRWLLNNGQVKLAKKMLEEAAVANKTLLKAEHLDALESDFPESKSITGIFQVFKYRRLTIRTLVIFFCWLVCSGSYYGLSLNTSNLGGDSRVNFLIAGAIEIPATILNFLTLDRFGRRRVLNVQMFGAGLFLIASSFISTDLRWITITFAMIGKMCIVSGFGALYILSAELYPTVIRNGSMGASSLCARVGSILSDYVLLLGEIWKPLPLLIFGGMSITAGILCLTLPETLGKRLPETIEDAEKFDRET